jgi:hypothetical protein
VLWLATGTGLFFLLSNITVMRGRLFAPAYFFTVPVAVYGLHELFAGALGLIARALNASASSAAVFRRMLQVAPESVLVAALASLAASQVLEIWPTLEYRLAYPPQRSFYVGMGAALPLGSHIYGANNCALANHYTNLTCSEIPGGQTDAEYEVFAAQLKSELESKAVFLLPDFLSYDERGTLGRRLPADFIATPVYTAWGEDYHALTYGPPVDEMIAHELVEARSCSVTTIDSQRVSINQALTVDNVSYHAKCPERAIDFTLLQNHGHIVFLKQLSVAEVHLRQGKRDP